MPKKSKGRKRYTVKPQEAIAIYRRVLKLVNGFMAVNCPTNTLVCNRRGTLMSWGELRQHIRESCALRITRPRSRR